MPLFNFLHGTHALRTLGNGDVWTVDAALMCLALWNWRLLHHAILSLPDRLDDLRHGFVAGLISDQARELRNDLPTHFTASAAWLIRCFTVSSC